MKNEKSVDRTRFKQLVKQWQNETAGMGMVQPKISTWPYLMIIGMGPDVLPLLLEQLDNGLDDLEDAILNESELNWKYSGPKGL